CTIKCYICIIDVMYLCIWPYTLSFYFFFQSSGHHRDLHSFPTRRSSDLMDAPRDLVRGLPDEQRGVPMFRNAAPWRGAACCAPTDRKSTRLNSSHDQISYAVFCLKKKKKQKKQVNDL